MGEGKLLAGSDLLAKNLILAEKVLTLAKEVPTGSCIVELGSYHGASAVLYHKAVQERVDIFTIDDFDLRRRSWLGQNLTIDDELEFYENIKGTKIIACRINIEEAVKHWFRAIGLLSWDIGAKGRFRQDFDDWSPFVIANGVVIVKDLPRSGFGTFEVIEELVESGLWKKIDYLNGVTFLRRIQ